MNAAQGNPYQPDVNVRGFSASPLPGTPQGISVFFVTPRRSAYLESGLDEAANRPK